MNEQQIQKSERIASRVMRFLAITGLVAVLALIAWLVVQGVRMAPNLGSNITAAVSAITSVFRDAPEEDIVFDLASRTLTSGQSFTVRWTYTGDSQDATRFSYDCSRNVSMSIMVNGAQESLVCGETRTIDQDTVVITPTSPEARFADITLHVTRGNVDDETLVTVVNTSIDTPAEAISVGDILSTSTPAADLPIVKEVTDTLATPSPVTPPATSPTPTVVAPTPLPTPTPSAPAQADLVVNIEETGVYVDVAGRPTFFPISPIPSDKRAGVVFTVTNRGTAPSGAWAFVANLPIEGDMKYRYASPVQAPLAPGMQVQFTLGFDEVIATGKGLVRIEIIPTGTDEREGNNVDAVVVEFK